MEIFERFNKKVMENMFFVKNNLGHGNCTFDLLDLLIFESLQTF